jgi:hypothetical protein
LSRCGTFFLSFKFAFARKKMPSGAKARKIRNKIQHG